MAKLLLGDDLQHPKFDENTARQILSLLHSPITTVTQNLTQPQATTSTQHKLVTRVPATLVTSRPPLHTDPVPLPPPIRGLMPPTKRLLPAKSTEQLTETLKEVMLEPDSPKPMMKKYKMYLQKQSLETSDTIETKM